MMSHVNELLEMAEWLKSAGEPDLARECVETANRFLDFFAFMDYCNRQRGACKGKSRATGSGDASRGEEPRIRGQAGTPVNAK